MRRILLLLLLATAATAEARVTLPSVFGDNMVLQQQLSVRIWGTSDQKEVILTASWGGDRVHAAVRDGRWEARIPTPAGSFEPQNLRIADADSEVTLSNVLIGEVWICSGQSNMAMPLRGYTGQPVEEAMQAALDAPRQARRIRMITLPRREADAPQSDFEGTWDAPTPESSLRMSAVAYFFARTLSDVLDVPVGIISTSWGGSKIEAWMDDASLGKLGYDVEKINADPKREPRAKCGLLYNGLIAPVANFTARGFTWYQGESNRKESAIYAHLMQELVCFWRTQWGDTKAQMPFLYVQIAPHAYNNAAATDAAELVEAQGDALALIPNSALIPTTDLGESACIHPSRKRPVGERLAAEALRLAYGMKLPDCSAVRFREAVYEDGKALVTFDNARHGLTPQDDEITGFELAGKDGVFHPATGRIVRSKPTVEVSSPEVSDPVAVRYAFRNFIPANLTNTMGWPAIPFRTDRR